MSLAAQTLSAAVASAIDFLRDELTLPQFQDSEMTTEFIKCIIFTFDVLKSSDMNGSWG